MSGADIEPGVLFVDEVYRIAQPSDNDFGGEAVEEIMRDLITGDPVVIMAGYPEVSRTFFSVSGVFLTRKGPSATLPPGRIGHVWEVCLGRMFGMYVWEVCLGRMFGMYVWEVWFLFRLFRVSSDSWLSILGSTAGLTRYFSSKTTGPPSLLGSSSPALARMATPLAVM